MLDPGTSRAEYKTLYHFNRESSQLADNRELILGDLFKRETALVVKNLCHEKRQNSIWQAVKLWANTFLKKEKKKKEKNP